MIVPKYSKEELRKKMPKAKYLYVSIGRKLKFGVWDQCDSKKPIGWRRAKDVIDKNYEFNKLKSLTMDEIIEIKNEIKKFALSEQTAVKKE